MKTVRDDRGNRYLLLKRSESASLVRDPETGDECYVRNDRLEFVDRSGLETAAATVDEPVRTLLGNVHDEETLGLLIELADRGPLGIRTLLDSYDLCESDLHGRLTVLTAAGLLEETELEHGVATERGYRVTDDCRRALETIRPARDDADQDEDASTNPADADDCAATGE
ncbi:DUF7346 family protein [Halobiforma nitratireducens]|uniref:Uncharacterized protein n=1 Tax=Halobiforma nitratireducens JCM 10879 TaxID=1227454 RepID=M0LLW2_9EURY|nr:hypothetical protein [Halobiforma nitratireducens]EMA34088.1 hypothetical protein C446_13629 [Halobiforma nitratireducens JCM 10879]